MISEGNVLSPRLYRVLIFRNRLAEIISVSYNPADSKGFENELSSLFINQIEGQISHVLCGHCEVVGDPDSFGLLCLNVSLSNVTNNIDR